MFLLHQFQEVAAYNEWAWQQVWASTLQLSAEAYTLERPVFWSSIRGILTHSMGAEQAWLQKLQGEAQFLFPTVAQFADFPALQTHWQTVHANWRTYLAALSEAELSEMIIHTSSKGQQYPLSIRQIITHVFNHATEHRSQLTPILFNLGVPTQPLDFMRYVVLMTK